jgi:type III pantothenate kinase
VSAVLVASVAGAALGDLIARKTHEQFGVQAEFVLSPASACGVRNAYPEPDRLGIDRFLGLVALHAAESGPCVLASCGTALTLDALAADGSHLGGLIAPSPPLMRDALTGATARLSTPQAARVVERADNTGDAIESGVWLAGAALLERFVARATATFGSAPSVVLTGGGAERLSTLIEPAHRIDAELVLHGLAIYAASLPADARPVTTGVT